MEFLKEILGDELFAQVQEKINAHNGADENKDKQIKLANLGAGGYVSKDKFNSKEQDLASKVAELGEANKLIEILKKGTKDNENLQDKITSYESQVAELQKELADTKLKAAIKVSLIGEKALDVDYLTFKLNEKLAEKGEKLELDESGNIKGWDEKLSGLKTQFPTMFESATAGGKKVMENKLPSSNEDRKAEPKSLAEALQMQYETNN